MRTNNGRKIQSILDEVHEKQHKLREEGEAHLKKLIEDLGLTLFEFIVDYEYKVVGPGLGLPMNFDDFDIDNNDYKLKLEMKTSLRKRTPEEREAFLHSLQPLWVCECGHYRTVHIPDESANCVEAGCECEGFKFEKAEHADSNNGQSRLG